MNYSKIKKGQSVIVAVFKNDELAETTQKTVLKGGADFFYTENSHYNKFSQITRCLDWERHGRTTRAFSSEEELNTFVERTPLLKAVNAFFDCSYKGKHRTLTNDQLKAILAIINQ